MTHGSLSRLTRVIRIISMDSHEIGLFFLRLFIVREDRLLLHLKLPLLSGTEFHKVDTHIRVRVSVRVLIRYCCSFRLFVLFSPLLEFGFFLMDHSKILVQDFCLGGILAEKIDLMLKFFIVKGFLVPDCWVWVEDFFCLFKT